MAPSRRNSNRAPRRSSRRDPDQGRSRNGSGRRSAPESERRSARQMRPSGADNKKVIYIGAGVAGLLFIFAIAAFSGSAPKPKRKKKRKVQPVMAVSTIDWYTQGYNRGAQWKSATSRRQMRPTAEEVLFVAERMTADYVNKGIDVNGEKRFIDGFKAAVLGN